MSQNTGEKQKNYLFIEAYLKTFPSVLPTTFQTLPKDTLCTLSCSRCRYHIFGSGVFELEGTIVLIWFLKEVYPVSHSDPVRRCSLSLNFSDIYGLAPDGNIKLRYSHALLLVTASTPPWKCCHNTEADRREKAAEKRFFHLCQVVFWEDQSLKQLTNTDPQTMVLPAGKGTGGAARTSGWVRTVWAHEKTNLDLWADQPLARLPSWLYSLPRGAQGSAMILQHSLATHMKRQSSPSAM